MGLTTSIISLFFPRFNITLSQKLCKVTEGVTSTRVYGQLPLHANFLTACVSSDQPKECRNNCLTLKTAVVFLAGWLNVLGQFASTAFIAFFAANTLGAMWVISNGHSFSPEETLLVYASARLFPVPMPKLLTSPVLSCSSLNIKIVAVQFANCLLITST